MKEHPVVPNALAIAALFEGGLIVVAALLGWLAGIDPLATLRADGAAVVVGLLAVLPMLILLWWGLGNPDSALARPTREARVFVERFFAGVGPGGFALVSLLAGIGEEVLFRGLLQPLIARHSSELTGLLGASLLFGLAHAVSREYMIAATVIGLYFGVLYHVMDGVTAPIVCHAVYDFLALVWLSRVSHRG